MIENVSFENVFVTMTKTSKWDCGLYDLRPCLDYGVEKIKNSGFFIRNAENVLIEKSGVEWGNVCDEYNKAIDAENAPGLEIIRFSGKDAH